LDDRLNVEKMAKECGIIKIYTIAYRILCLPAHGNLIEEEFEIRSAVPGTLEAIRCVLKALHLIVLNYVRGDRITDQNEILKIFFP
jgi:hypothetical protein